MPVTAVVGAQWGDEGKGRVVDLMAQEADVVVRFQGGNNAGHTVVNEHGKFALHLIPSGIFNPHAYNILGAGTVVHPGDLLEEMARVRDGGASFEHFVISERAQVVMPYHPLLDELDERHRDTGGAAIGTTRKGIGPCYTDKAARCGLQMDDLLDRDYLADRVHQLVPMKNAIIEKVYDGAPLDPEAVLETLWTQGQALQPHIRDTQPILEAALAQDDRVLLEGQLGALRDIDWGTYPFVTSSSPTAGGAAGGAGIPPHRIQHVIGVAKAYTTAVGAGPFPTELHGEQAERLRELGGEYGATTGRPRRCGWFDAVAVRHAAGLNGFTALALTKLDVLDGVDEIRIGVGYRLDGEALDRVPTTRRMARVEPVYETMPGWSEPTGEARQFEDLPEAAQRYVERLEALCGVAITMVSVGAERNEIIHRPVEAVAI